MKQDSLAAAVIVIWCEPHTLCRNDIDTPLPDDDYVSKEYTEMRMDVGDRTFVIILNDTEAASEFISMAPLELRMHELNGNEKYANLDRKLTSSPSRVSKIHAGDIMLYGDDCLVVFYETFETPYSYTPIGKVVDVSGLAESLGDGDVTVSFS